MSDSFADLWNTSAPLPAKPKPQTLTLAARLAEERNRHRASAVDLQSQKAPDVSHATWAGLDSLDSGIKVKVDDDDDWGLRDFGSAAVNSDSNPKSTSTSKNLWDLDNFTSSTGPTPPRSTTSYLNPQSRPISRSTSRLSHHSSFQVHRQKVDSPDMDFDFGSREDPDDNRDILHTNSQALKSSAILHLLDNDNEHHSLMGGTGNYEDEEDILGVLSKPVEVVIAKKNSDSRTSTGLSHPFGQGSRPPSPPPHVLGQIVEMGFSVSQAKKALAATGNGQDVQAALESLLSGGGYGGNNLNERSPTPSIRAAQTRATPPPPHPPTVRGPPKGQKERERERKERELLRTRREDTSSTRAGPTTAADIQDHADKLLLQASEIGLSVLSRASAFWKEGKEKVVKVMEERSGGAGTSSGVGIEDRGRGKNVDGRPKWMKEIVNHEDEDDEFGEEGFKDTGVEERIDVAHHEPTVDLFSSDPIPTRPVLQQRPPLSQRPSQPRTDSRPPRPQRTLPTTSSSTLSLASTHKNTGTSQFKLGQYGSASESYTSAITLLPPGHLLLVPLYTNRSLARLRCGEHVGAGEDAGEALKIICVVDSNIDTNSNLSSNGNVIWNPDTELPELIQGGRDKLNQGGWLDARGVGVDLIDGYVKALRRRAEAWEGREKWVEAGKDWEVLAGGGGGVGGGWIGEGIKKEAVRGAGRCRRMVTAGGQESIGSSFPSSSSSAPKQSLPKLKLKSSPRPSPPSSQPSKALLAHQATTLRVEADDTLKHQLKDSVDARISAWKNGKETNIRALLASLDMVLWDEILSGGVKVNGLGELVTNAQVKKGYMKAIAKVHPDKFNTSNSTVEQRMLVNSVFAALNEAWIAFQGGK